MLHRVSLFYECNSHPFLSPAYVSGTHYLLSDCCYLLVPPCLLRGLLLVSPGRDLWAKLTAPGRQDRVSIGRELMWHAGQWGGRLQLVSVTSWTLKGLEHGDSSCLHIILGEHAPPMTSHIAQRKSQKSYTIYFLHPLNSLTLSPNTVSLTHSSPDT